MSKPQRPGWILSMGLLLVCSCADDAGTKTGDGAAHRDGASLFDGASSSHDTASSSRDGASSADGRGLRDGSAVRRAPEQYPYDPTRFAFRQKIPSGIASDSRSAAIVARLDQNSSEVKVGLSAGGEVPPVYLVKSSDPLYSVTVGGKKRRFRVPASAVPGKGSDYPLVLLDRAHPDFGAYTELRLWQARIDRTSKTLSANGAGLFHYNNDGKLLNPDKTPSISVPFAGWGTGCGLSILAGLIRPDEVKRGAIEHAIRFAYSPCNSTNTYRAPATKTDQPKGCSTVDPRSAMEMGMRLQLSRSVDCRKRTVPGKSDSSKETRFLRMLCRALQDYGMIMVDGTQPKGLLLMMESKETASWSSIVGSELWGSYGYIIRDDDTPSDGQKRDASSGIPWGQLRVLAKSVF